MSGPIPRIGFRLGQLLPGRARECQTPPSIRLSGQRAGTGPVLAVSSVPAYGAPESTGPEHTHPPPRGLRHGSAGTAGGHNHEATATFRRLRRGWCCSTALSPGLHLHPGDRVRTVSGSIYAPPRSAVFTNVSGLKGGNFVRIAGVEVGKVKDLTPHKDGTVTVDFAIDKTPTLIRGNPRRGALRKPDRRPLPVPGRGARICS